MTPQEFAGRWQKSPLIQFSLAGNLAAGLSESSRQALQQYGLPQHAEPWLHFMEFLKTDDRTAAVLDEQQVYPIGCLPNGDIICIEKNADRVMICDHEDPHDMWLLNSSLAALYECIVLFDGFIAAVNEKNPRYASDFSIPDGMLREFEQSLIACDAAAIAEKGFWYNEIQALDDSTY